MFHADPQHRAQLRFWRGVKLPTKSLDECMFWQKSLNGSGYGQLAGLKGRTVGAHHLAWELFRGPIPPGLHVMHKCDVRYPVGDTTYRACCSIHHLKLGTAQDNALDKVAKGRAGLDDYRHMTPREVTEVRYLHSNGFSETIIADAYGFKLASISRCVNYISYPDGPFRNSSRS